MPLSSAIGLPEADHQLRIGAKAGQLAIKQETALQAVAVAESQESARPPDSSDGPPLVLRIDGAGGWAPDPSRENLNGHDVLENAERYVRRKKSTDGKRVAAPSSECGARHGSAVTTGGEGRGSARPISAASACTAAVTSGKRLTSGW